MVTNNADVFMWEGYGLKLCVCEDSLPKDKEKCKISVKTSISGQYEFPENLSLVSGIVWLRCEPLCKFSKPITLKMEHSATAHAAAKLSFVRAFCTKKKATYVFKELPGGHFNKDDGAIELTGFSGLGIAGENPDREYCARIFYLSRPRITSYKIDFVVTWNTKIHHAVSCYRLNLILGGGGSLVPRPFLLFNMICILA